MAGSRYGLAFGAAVIALAVGAFSAWRALGDNEPRPAAAAQRLTTTPSNGAVATAADTLASPMPATAGASSSGAAGVLVPSGARAQHRADSRGAVWHASAEQALRDTLYRLGQAGRLAESASILAAWTQAHPGDRAAALELARLELRLGRQDAAFETYRSLLAAGDDEALRREYASALLAAGRYDDSAREFGTLSQRAPDDAALRLGLARSLAWGNHPAAAEQQLRWLAAHPPVDTSVAAMLVAVRGSYDPSASDAAGWVRERPDFAPYRLALARALLREGRAAEGAAQFDTLLARTVTVAMLAEAAEAHALARDSIGAARLLGEAVRRAPQDTTLGRRWAESLARAGDVRGAIAEYGQLLAKGERADLLLARGRVRAWSGDLAGASTDLARAAQLEPSYDAYALLGDVERWRGRAREARTAYARALALRPGDAAVLASLGALREQEVRLAMGGTASEEGWSVIGNYAEDNTGYLYLSSGVAGGVAVGRATTVSATAEQRRVSMRSVGAPERYVYGFAAGAAASHWLGGGARLAASGGIVRHGVGGTIGYGTLSASAPVLRRARLDAGVETGPAYAMLMSMPALTGRYGTNTSAGAAPLTARSARIGASAPIGRAEVELRGEAMRLSDGNARHTVTGAVRLPVAYGFSALYTGGTLGYSGRSEAYWDPTRYTSHALGVAWGYDRGGLHLGARALPGVGRTSESIAFGGSDRRLPTRSAAQLALGADAALRRERFDVVGSAGYGRGREGGYQSLGGTLRVRIAW